MRQAAYRLLPMNCTAAMRGWLLLLALMLLLPTASLASTACPETDAAFPSPHPDRTRFDAAIATEAGYQPSQTRLTGLTVPHHLVAANLIARGFRAASGFTYRRVIVLTPDHFSRSERPFATSHRSFETVFGDVSADVSAVTTLLGSDADIGESCLFAQEHGLTALLPFVRHHFPEAALVPIAISKAAKRADWDRLADALAGIVDTQTLIVQSTDFSHYHPHEIARQYDQQVLNVISAGSLDQIALLHQPDHLDSVGGMYLQMKLQREIHGASPVVIASENQQQYTQNRLDETTGYLVALFARFPERIFRHEPGADLIYFAGDTHFARAMAPVLSDADAADKVLEAVLRRTGGAPLVVNLEGVILPNVPEGLGHMTLAMPGDLVLPWLERLNVAAVGLANNHVNDLGPTGVTETASALTAAGVRSFGQGEAIDIGRLTIVGLTDLDSNGPPYTDLIDDALIARLAVSDAERLAVAFVHWGREYIAEPASREVVLAETMRLHGASVIVGAHPHVADGHLSALGSGETMMAYSLGNFLFDQSSRTSSGSLLELRIFPQGTYFARLIPLPNLFDVARSARR